MMPQAPINNRQTWARFEDNGRTLVVAGNKVYIITGSGTNGYATTINNCRITVPSNCRKAMMVLPVGIDDAGRVITSTRVIAVDMFNTNSIGTA